MTESAPTSESDKSGGTAQPPSYASTELFQGSRVLVITHAGDAYRLMVTRNNRLILQK